MKDNKKCPITGVTASRNRSWSYTERGKEYLLYDSSGTDIAFWEPRTLDVGYYESDSLNNQAMSHANDLTPSPWNDYVKHSSIAALFKGGSKVLDIGCGNGSFLNTLTNRDLELIGIDLDRVAIEAAKNNGVTAKFEVASLTEFNEDGKYNGYFDIITIFEVLEHQTDPVQFLEEIKILLKPQGLIIGSTPNKNRFSVRIGLREPFDYPPNHFFWFGLDGLEDTFKKAGYTKKMITSALNYPRLNAVRHTILSKFFMARNKSKISSTDKSEKSKPRRSKEIVLLSLSLAMIPIYPVFYLANRILATTTHFGFIFRSNT